MTNPASPVDGRKILLIGGSGLLGRELQRLDSRIVAPIRHQLDITWQGHIIDTIGYYRPNIVIHAAAVTDNRQVEIDPTEAISINIQGTANVALACYEEKIRLVYISTDYVYPGVLGHYREDDALLPCNPYAWTKLGGEASVRLIPNHLIIRTSFGPSIFPYEMAFEDKWSSKGYVDEIAPEILRASLSPLTGVLNLGFERESILAHARRRNPNVRGIRIQESGAKTPVDTSLNTDRWRDS